MKVGDANVNIKPSAHDTSRKQHNQTRSMPDNRKQNNLKVLRVRKPKGQNRIVKSGQGHPLPREENLSFKNIIIWFRKSKLPVDKVNSAVFKYHYQLGLSPHFPSVQTEMTWIVGLRLGLRKL